MLRELPGDVWTIGSPEAHCLRAAVERLLPFLDEEQAEDLAVWEMILASEQGFQLTPNDWDRAFLETLLAGELERLWRDEAAPDCEHTSEEHIALLRELQRRLITEPKRYALAREARAQRRRASDRQRELP